MSRTFFPQTVLGRCAAKDPKNTLATRLQQATEATPSLFTTLKSLGQKQQQVWEP
jgi:hypothetical protein